jgi:hypothetical protein
MGEIQHVVLRIKAHSESVSYIMPGQNRAEIDYLQDRTCSELHIGTGEQDPA